MKINPSNQTLILASERSDQGISSGKTTNAAASVLQRVTIVASRPDSVLYLQADYSTDAGGITDGSSPYLGRSSGRHARQSFVDAPLDSAKQSSSQGASPSNSLVARQQSSPALRDAVALHDAAARRDVYGNALTTTRDTGISAYLKPAEQYARTQRILADKPQIQQIDVLA